MKPIIPARILGGSILVEATPISSGITNVYRGVEIGAGAEEIASGPQPGAALSGPYRAWQSAAAGPSGTPVIVRELGEAALGMSEAREAFEQKTIARGQLIDTPAPRLLHAFEHRGGGLASVEEYLSGTPISEVLRALRASGRELPVDIALAIGRGLVALWTNATAHSIRVLVDSESVLLDPRGEVRVLPDYAEERARQTVGAAIMILRAPVAYASPEEITGARVDARGPMFGLGLLLYEMLTGAHPVATEDGTMFQILSSLAQHDIPHLRTRRAGIHPSVSELVHRCLARDPRGRFDSWKELGRAYSGVQSLFAASGAREIASLLDEVIPQHPLRGLPAVADLEAWRSLPNAGYEAVALRAAAPVQRSEPRWTTRLDRDAVYPTADARPMYAAGSILVDARPVTRAEFERFLLMTRRPRPMHLDSPSPANEEDACVLVSVEEAAAYARWAGKRIPTEGEWESAVMALGAGKLGVGDVWEWTNTAHPDGGHVVRGGRWRDQASVPARPENRSFAISPAADLGFRCVVGDPSR